jgi:hypothetical protein
LIAGGLFFLSAAGPLAALLLAFNGLLKISKVISAISFAANFELTRSYGDYNPVLVSMLRWMVVLLVFVALPFPAGPIAAAAANTVLLSTLGFIYAIINGAF